MENLRLYLTHFAARRCSHAPAVGEGSWRAFAVRDAGEGERVEGPLFSGVAGRTLDEMVLVRGDDRFVEVSAHGATLTAREEPAWRAWMDEHVTA